MLDKKLLTPTEIIRSNRRTISLTVDREGNLIVRAPLRTKDIEIEKFITDKAKWITTKRLSAMNSTYSKLTFRGNETIYLVGKPYKIVLTNAKRVKVEGDEIFVPNTQPELYLKNYLVTLCKRLIPKRLDKICELFGFKYKGFSITSATTRWGSCAYNNHLNFTYKIIMCPREVIDYLMVHELCHTKVKNHSAKFWQKVEEVLPNYKAQEKWLKDNRKIIDVI